jgi:mycothiol synthase
MKAGLPRQIVFRPYTASDDKAVVALWNQCLPCDKIDLDTFRKKVVLDVNFDEEGCHLVESEGTLCGFVLALRRRYPYFDLGLQQGLGWITVFFVHSEWRRKGIARGLFDRAESFLRSKGVREISVSDYTPNYITPGIDIDAYVGAQEFLEGRGYQKSLSVYGMGRSLGDFSVSGEMQDRFKRLAQAGFSVQVFEPCRTLQLLEFLREQYPGDLFRVAHDRLIEDPECDEILLALKHDQVVGFSHFRDEHFGPFGISKEYGGRGLGPLLYYKTVEQMRKKGRQNLWLAWTTGRAKDFYHKLGLTVLRRHVVMKKRLVDD